MVSHRAGAPLARAVRHASGDGLAAALALALVVLGPGATAAGAHGPCRCLPRVVRPGDAMVTSRVLRAVWNPARADIHYREPALIAAHVATSPRVVLLDRRRDDAEKRARLVVPDVPPGRHLVLMYDGSEGGSHYTWDFVTVRGRPPSSPPSTVVADGRSSTGPAPVAAIVAGGLALAVLGAALGRRRRHARRDAPGRVDEPQPRTGRGA